MKIPEKVAKDKNDEKQREDATPHIDTRWSACRALGRSLLARAIRWMQVRGSSGRSSPRGHQTRHDCRKSSDGNKEKRCNNGPENGIEDLPNGGGLLRVVESNDIKFDLSA